jgi:hypothetical protein
MRMSRDSEIEINNHGGELLILDINHLDGTNGLS